MLKMKWTVVSTHLYPNRGALPALKKKFVCEPLPVIFVVSIVVVSTLLQVILKLVTT